MDPPDDELSCLPRLVDVGVLPTGGVHHALPVPSAETSGKDGEDHESAADEAASGGAAARVEALIENMGRQISDASPHRPALAESLAALSRLGADDTADDLTPYARLATSPAGLDVAQLEGIEDRITLAERAVVLSVLFEPVVRLLRCLAQEDANHRRHDRRACGRGGEPAERVPWRVPASPGGCRRPLAGADVRWRVPTGHRHPARRAQPAATGTRLSAVSSAGMSVSLMPNRS